MIIEHGRATRSSNTDAKRRSSSSSSDDENKKVKPRRRSEDESKRERSHKRSKSHRHHHSGRKKRRRSGEELSSYSDDQFETDDYSSEWPVWREEILEVFKQISENVPDGNDELLELLREIDKGHEVDISSVPDREVANLLRRLFEALNLKATSFDKKGDKNISSAFRKPSEAVRLEVNFVSVCCSIVGISKRRKISKRKHSRNKVESVNNTAPERDLSPIRDLKDRARDLSPIRGSKDTARDLSPIRDLKDRARDLSPIRGSKDRARDLSPIRGSKDRARDLSPIRGSKDRARDLSPIRGSSTHRGGHEESSNVDLQTSQGVRKVPKGFGMGEVEGALSLAEYREIRRHARGESRKNEEEELERRKDERKDEDSGRDPWMTEVPKYMKGMFGELGGKDKDRRRQKDAAEEEAEREYQKRKQREMEIAMRDRETKSLSELNKERGIAARDSYEEYMKSRANVREPWGQSQRAQARGSSKKHHAGPWKSFDREEMSSGRKLTSSEIKGFIQSARSHSQVFTKGSYD